MRLSPTGRSRNLEDRRGARVRPMGIGIGGLLIALVVGYCTGINPLALVGVVNQVQQAAPPGDQTAPVTDEAEEPMVRFLSGVLDDAQAVWTEEFSRAQVPYREAKLVLFRDLTRTSCGYGEAASGPFYCPGDEKVYIDLGFYEELRTRFGAPGDFAQAYVLAHEIGHHVQRLTGTEEQVRGAQRSNPGAANQLSVAMELQADCYAGIWGHSAAARGLLEPGDIEEGLGAAAAVGDDRLQRAQTGTVNPDAFTHGTSEQRMRWFRQGFDSGNSDLCNPFEGMQ